MTRDHDLLVLGGGPASERGAAQAAYFGKRVAIVERERAPGGAAVHTGTLPSKTLRETALFLSGYRQRDLYGVTVDVDPRLTVARLLERKDVVRGLEMERIHANLARHGVELVHGRGASSTRTPSRSRRRTDPSASTDRSSCSPPAPRPTTRRASPTTTRTCTTRTRSCGSTTCPDRSR